MLVHVRRNRSSGRLLAGEHSCHNLGQVLEYCISTTEDERRVGPGTLAANGETCVKFDSAGGVELVTRVPCGDGAAGLHSGAAET